MKKIKLFGKYGKGKFALIDDENHEHFSKYRWFLGTNGYPCRNQRINHKPNSLRMHREILSLKENEECDHINGNRLDNRKENLRKCSRIENARNTRLSIKNTSGFKGVHFDKRRNLVKRWRAYIVVFYKQIHLGNFSSAIEAGIAYNEAAKRYFGKFANLNKISS